VFAKTIPLPPPCGEQTSLEWIHARRLVVHCRVNPSASAYTELDAITGETVYSGLGFGFTRSPDGRHIAHVGWIPHFSSPSERSHYLEIDGKPVYPKPTHRKQELNFARKVGNRYVSIHEFQQPWVWSPDSSLVALMDHEFDWEPRTEGEIGSVTNERYYLVVAGAGLTARRVRIEESFFEGGGIRWITNTSIEITGPKRKQEYRLADLSQAY
jgi:hypothetical protein